MPLTSKLPTIPRSNDALSDLHHEYAGEFQEATVAVFEAITHAYDEKAAHESAKAMLLACGALGKSEIARFDEIGWREYFSQEADGAIDFVDRTSHVRNAAEYARQGISPRYPETSDIAERERRIIALIARGQDARKHGRIFFGDQTAQAWEGAFARHAYDFGAPLTLRGIHLLTGVSMPAIQNAVSAGTLPVTNGLVPAEDAIKWVSGRREFCPSRWRDPTDDLYPFDPRDVVQPRDGKIFVPKSDDSPFMPNHVARPAKQGGGLSITTCGKGDERRFSDFYEALQDLAEKAGKADVARWRRRNSVGNWGIVRARGAWIAVEKAEIDRQIAAKLAEA